MKACNQRDNTSLSEVSLEEYMHSNHNQNTSNNIFDQIKGAMLSNHCVIEA